MARKPTIDATVEFYSSFLGHGERGVKWLALGVALILHAAVLIVQLPEVQRKEVPKKTGPVLIVKKYIPPPPVVQRKQIAKRQLTRKIPIPDPTPDMPEPIREPLPEIQDVFIPPDVEIMIGEPEPPPPARAKKLIAGAAGVTNPIIIEETKITPDYPEIARLARVQCRVILNAIIGVDGTVEDVAVLRCTHPEFGFEAAAVEAVQQWRYEPATQNGRPVGVYFTVVVDFVLNRSDKTL